MELLIGIYIFVCILYLFLCSASSVSIQTSKPSIAFILLSFTALLYMHCAVDLYSVEDLWSYANRFQEAASMSFANFSDAFRTNEYAFNYFSWIVSLVTHDFRLFLVIYNIILLTIYYYTFKKYSVNVPLAIICMILTVYFQSIFVLRQHLAISILLLSLPFIINKKLIPYLLICVLAFNIHISAIAWLPVYFIYNIEGKKTYLLSLVISAFAITTIISNIGDVFLLIEADYSSYLESNTKISTTKNLINVTYLIIYAITLKGEMFKNGINRLATTLLFLCTIGYILAPPVALVDRMLTYYSIATVFTIPLIWYYLPSPALKNLFVFVVIILQGYVSIQPLSADYYKNFTIVALNFPYVIMCIVATILVYKIYSKPNY